ncbi:2,3-butanediol dehydrogenase [Haloarcula amylovorans]|uniref:2,3-butanediol dehydrogenase n=1 Tax=Haloarcula amylovorans TaxID=2562280 RepID=UPI0010766F1A|nr:2,3-butanediol dehydrogenase [Halomicroarcula amylolytica]
MKAAVYYGPEDVRVEDVSADEVGPADVRIDVAWCGICGTDLHEYLGGPIFVPDEPHPRTGKTLPLTLGHEFTGTIAEVGTDVERLSVGDRVVVEPNIPCGECYYCEEGRYNLCENAAAIGLQTDTGGFAENAVVPEQQVHELPDEVSLKDGALVEPLAVGLHAVRRADISPGDTAAVFGAGPIGLTVVHAAQSAGVKRLFVSEPQTVRREKAAQLGADVTIDPLSTDPVERIKSETPGGVDAAFEYAGVDPSFNAAVKSTRRGGTVTVGAVFEEETSTDLKEIVTTERTVLGSQTYAYPPLSFRSEFDAVIQSLAADEVDTDAFVSATIDLDDIVAEGFEAIDDPENGHVKVLVSP